MAKFPKKITKKSLGKAVRRSMPPSGMSARDASIMAPYGRKAMKTPRAPSR